MVYNKKYYKKNKQKLKENYNRYYQKNRDNILKRKKKWRNNNPKYFKRYYSQNKKKILDNLYKWRKRNPNKKKESDKRYRAKHGKKIKIRIKNWRIKNPDKLSRYTRDYRKRYPKRHNAQERARRKIKIEGVRCKYCNNKAEHRHHEDYNKPFKIIPLCIKCHNKIHNNKMKRKNENVRRN